MDIRRHRRRWLHGALLIMGSFTIKSQEYQSVKLTTIKQAHLMRRLLPIVSSLANLSKLKSDNQGDTAKEAFQPIADALSNLSDEQFNYILDLCLSVVKRRDVDANRLVPIWNGAGKNLQYEDIDLMVMLQIMGNVIMENLSGFLPESPSNLGELLSTVQTSNASS
jgi:hypothetical protein